MSSDAKYLTRIYDRNRRNFSKKGEDAYQRGMSSALEAASYFLPVPPVFQGAKALARGAKYFGGVGNFIKNTVNPGKYINVLTSKGIKTVPKNKFKGTVARRIEDAYIGTPGYKMQGGLPAAGRTGKETANWFSTQRTRFYGDKTKDALSFMQGKSGYLPEGALRRGMKVNLSPGKVKEYRKIILNPTTTAHNISGGVGNAPHPYEIIIPSSVTNLIRSNKVPFAKTFFEKTSKEIIKRVNK
tara:strand:- start:132 stop:857 length:726 start_codon:yes stop_codon:yes gene_type:complete